MASSMLTSEVSASGTTDAEVDKALKATLHSCANDPDFAVICDFLQKFSKDLGFELPNFKLLLHWLTKTDEVSSQLRDMQIKLLRKTRKTVHEKSWESALSKFCFTYSAQDGWEIERFGYKNSSVKVKLRILRELLECQFERNTKFRSKILTLSAESLRSKPIGRDRMGHAYWVTQDNDCNIQIYQEHLDEEIWRVVATNRDEFVNLLKRLRGSEVVQPCKDISVVDEDTTSSSSHLDTNSVQKATQFQGKDDSQEEQKIPKLSIKLGFGRNAKEISNPKDVGKGEEELAAEEDANLQKKSVCSEAVENGEEEFEEIEEESCDESCSEGESEDQINEEKKILTRPEHNLQKKCRSKGEMQKVRPLLISQNKILKCENISTPNIGKKRNIDLEDFALSSQSKTHHELKKLRPSLLDSKRLKSITKFEDTKRVSGGNFKVSSDENIEEEEVDEEDIDSAAAEEDENEEKLFEDYDDEDAETEVGEEISDPIVKVIGEGSGIDCDVENYLYYMDYDLGSFVSPTFEDIVVEDVRYVYGEGSGESCLVGNNKVKDDEEKTEKESLNASKTDTEEKSVSNSEYTLPKKENNNFEHNENNKISTSKNSVPNEDNVNDKKKGISDLDSKKKNCDENNEKSLENANEIEKQINSKQELKEINGDKIFKDKFVENELNPKQIPESFTPCDSKTPPDEKVLECLCETDNISSKDPAISNAGSSTQEGAVQQAHASKKSALESLKKELRESKQKLLEKKLPQKNESFKTKSSSVSTYNRKRRFTDQLQTTAGRPNNSESEIDLNSENNEYLTNEKEVDIDESEKDVGGKRLKMRSKQANFELRKKIEAQKDATNAETTSSSGGEEELKKQRKQVVPKQFTISTVVKPEEELQSFEYNKDHLGKIDKNSLKDVEKNRSTDLTKVVASKPTKTKPTLAEIIETKLKKSTQTDKSNITPAENKINKEVAIAKNVIPSPNKDPIIKPLKKNVLIQIRQEANEDAVPRKRSNSQDLNLAVLSNIKSVGTATKDSIDTNDFKTDIEKQRNTLERQRKRRSSEEIVQNDIPEEPEAKKEVTADKEKVTLKRDKPNESVKEIIKVELTDLEMEKQSLLPISARRSGRRGGIITKYIDTSLSKRNRNTPKSSKESTGCVKVDTNNQPSRFEKSNVRSNNLKNDANKSKTEKLQDDRTTTLNENVINESKTKTNANLLESIPPQSSSVTKTPTKSVRKQRDVDTTNIIDIDSETPVRQSRRIAQQKIREEAERRKLEEIALRTMKQELKKKKKAEKHADPTIAPPTEPSSDSEESDIEVKRKSQKKKFPGKNGNWSSGSEEQEEPEEEEEEHHHYETDPGSPLFRSDHEFSPESEIEDESQVVPMKRARTVRKEDADCDSIAINKEEEACQKCNKSDHPEWILLCDNCDKGYHCSCLSPVLFYIPEGDWYCPPCQQEQLIKALEKQLKEFDDLVENKKKKEEDEKRIAEEEKVRQEKEEETSKHRIKKDKKINTKTNNNNSSSDDHSQEGDEEEGVVSNSDASESSNSKNQSKHRNRSRGFKNSEKRYHRDRRLNAIRNRRNRLKQRGRDFDSDSCEHSSNSRSVSKSNSSSSSTYSESDNEPIYKLRKRRQINVSYRLNEYDDLINSALKKEMDEIAGAGNLGRGKDISTIIEADKEEKARQKQKDDEISVNPNEVKNDQKVQEKLQASLKDERDEANKEEIKEKVKKLESDSDAEPIIRKLNIKPLQKKKSRKLTTLDISSEDDDGSDEDFKGSSIDDDEEEDTSISASNSDSSLEIYKKHGKFKKKRRKAARRSFRERRRDRRFLVDESEDEDVHRPKSKKKRKDDSDYTESEADDDDISELSENIDSADLCDDTTTDESDGAWRPNKRKKATKSNAIIARKSPKLKSTFTKKPKKVEYSDDDVSDSEEDEDESEDIGSGKGMGKQPRSQPLKKTVSNSTKTKGKGKGKEEPVGKTRNKKSSSNESSQSNSEDSTRRTRGRRYAYIEDFDDESSDGGIKPGVQRPDTPPEEREKFIKRQEEIKRMLAEKNAEGAKLIATPRLTPIKTDSEKDKKLSTKSGGDSLSTVPLSVIRQAKVLDIDYLQRRGENLDDLSTEVGEVDDDFDDADLPDDLPEDMDEDAIARMVEEEEGFVVAAARELPAPDEILRTSNTTKPVKIKETEKSTLPDNSSLPIPQSNTQIIPVTLPTPSSGLQEPTRKRLPMPTIHPPLLRHQYLMHDSMPNTHHLMQRQSGPPTSHLLQNALSAPLSQPLDRNYPSSPTSPHHSLVNRMAHSIPLQSTVTHALSTNRPPHSPSSSINTKSIPLLDGSAQGKSTNLQNFTENKPRGRRKKITPLRDTLQKQQTAAAVTAATASSSLSSSLLKNNEPLLSSVIKSGSPQKLQIPASVITNMQSTTHPSTCRPGVPMPPMRVPFIGTDGPRFYDVLGNRTAQSMVHRHRAPSQVPPSLLPPPSANRPSYGPPPLKGSNSGPTMSSSPNASGSIRNPIQHIPPTYLGMPPNARHTTSHINMYRPPIYGNPNFGTRSTLRPPNIHSPEFTPGSRAYTPYGFYPPPPPLTTPGQRPGPGSISRTSTLIPPVQPNIAHPPTSVIVSSKSQSVPLVTLKHIPAPVSEINDPSSNPKPVAEKKDSLNKIQPTKSSSPIVITQTEKSEPLSATVSRKKLTTLQAYSSGTSKKSPVLPVSDSSESRSPPNPSTRINDDSSVPGSLESVQTADQSTSKEGQASEFSGLVSYFSSQHDDYNT